MISVIICTYNRSDLLSIAIKSVLLQTYKDIELIIIDDASTDDTGILIGSLTDERIKYYKNNINLGISKSRNLGISMARGEYIAMLDSDDYWLDNNKLQKQLNIFNQDSRVGLVGTGIICFNEKGIKIKEDIFKTQDNSIRKKILFKNQFAQSSVLFKKEVFNLVAGYDESLVVCEDFDLWLKIGRNFRLANIGEPLVAYLIHNEGISKKNKYKIAIVTNQIINKYKKDYPGYFKAKLKSILRIFLSLWSI
ncbi:MAG: glycosyltransferase [Candidatus Parcubacteria bacterium]|jgi:glycosyltransferase involved in cell wall biosynthesis|nr:MAG: hypothetical protein JST_4590 [Candidatus Parcubacteria bacterium]